MRLSNFEEGGLLPTFFYFFEMAHGIIEVDNFLLHVFKTFRNTRI